MRRFMCLACLSVFALLLTPVAAWAQYPSELVGFNGPPIDDPATSQEMFRQPQHSGSTDLYIILNDPNLPYGNNAAFRASGLQTEGAAALEAYFRWVDPADPNGWLRLTTFNGPERPNPSLHTQGKVRFKLINRSEYFLGEIGICLGIRETGENMPQLADGGSSGDIEWVGVTGVVPDPNDPNVPIAPVPAITLPVSSDPEVPYELEWDLSTGVVSLDGAPQGGGIAGFTGDGILNAPNNRGTLEHIAFTNVVTDTAVLIHVAIDELQFEAPEPDPVLPPTVVGPILIDATEVTVTDLMFNVEQVTLYVNDGFLDSQTVSSPDDVVFTITPAVPADVYTATQTIGGIESPPSEPVVVTFTDQAPAIYMAPAEGADVVTVLGLDPDTTLVEINLNGTPTFSAVPTPGADRVDVPVAGLVMGDQITAIYWVGGAPSIESGPDTVTTNTTTVILSDDFESYADQPAMDAVWTQGGDVPVELSTERNATCPEGLQSSKTPPANSWMYQPIPQTVPTPTEPVVFNVNIYDPVGEDPNGFVVQWAELNYLGGPDWFFMHVGMLGWADTDNVHYDFRAVGNGGPNWVDLDEYDAPLRSVGWHNFTVVHKGNFIDVYVDEKLSLKNLELNAETTYAQCEIGGGDWGNAVDVWIDDLWAETGPVRFGCIAEQELPGDVDGDGDVDLTDLAMLLSAYGSTIGDPNYNPDADFDGDGDVDLTDLATLLSNYGT